MLILSQLWLYHRHHEKILEEGGGEEEASSLSRSLSAFHLLSQEYTLSRLDATGVKAAAQADEELQQKVLEQFSKPPRWVTEYAQWHREKMAQLEADRDSWRNERFLIARCLKSDRQRCGDASHRLMSIPVSLLMAKKSNRIFLIKWTQPADLENYLLPPEDNGGGETIDWRIPDWLQSKLGDLGQYDNIIGRASANSFQDAEKPDQVVIMRHVARDQGKPWYSRFQQADDPPFRIAFGHIWRMMFRPSQPVQAMLTNKMEALGITPGSYTTLQVKTLREEEETPEAIQNLVKSSLACAKRMSSDTEDKIIVASESQAILDAAMEMPGPVDRLLAVRSSPHILSLDKETEEWENHSPKHYYPAFAYLYIFANAKCASYFDDIGGRWGSLISPNPICAALMHWKPPLSVECDKIDPSQVVPPIVQAPAAEEKPGGAVVESGPLETEALVETEANSVNRKPIPEFPRWLNDYFAWHREELEKLNESNWHKYRYLVLRCLATDEKCGGASDRLQSFLLGLLFGSLSERLVFIHWERPAPLEEFLVPTPGGIDWRLPQWLDEKFDYDKARMLVTTAFKPVTRNTLLVTMRHQQFWPEFYDDRKQDDERSYEEIFHDVWRRTFEPSLPVEAMTEKAMREMDIEPDKYVAVHVRAKYFRDKTGDAELIQNAINCASRLRPGWPIYFASDSSRAMKIAVEYGKSVGGKVVARSNPREPLHLDRGEEFLNHRKRFTGYSDVSASQYYDVFVDLYLLANSQCVAMGYGGYGRLGSMLSFNRTCSVDYLADECQWTSQQITATDTDDDDDGDKESVW